jgi:lipopolysaccharide export system protein LptA
MNASLARAAALALALVAAGAAGAQTRSASRSGLGDLGSSKEPIKIDADRLDVFDKEGRAVFSGNVVAVQGDSTMNCSAMNVFYEGGRGAALAGGLAGGAGGTAAGATAAAGGGGTAAAPAGPSSGVPSSEAIKQIECRGPVTITSKTQTATGDRAEFDRRRNKVFLIGNAALSDGPNVTRGERVSYDLNTGVANVEGGRVRALIVPGSQKTAPAAPAAPAGQAPRPR